MKKTAVEKFAEQVEQHLLVFGSIQPIVFNELVKKAKDIEDQQNEDMYKKGWFDAIETYGGNK